MDREVCRYHGKIIRLLRCSRYATAPLTGAGDIAALVFYNMEFLQLIQASSSRATHIHLDNIHPACLCNFVRVQPLYPPGLSIDIRHKYTNEEITLRKKSRLSPHWALHRHRCAPYTPPTQRRFWYPSTLTSFFFLSAFPPH